MILCKSPTRTPALVPRNRRNALKSTGPHTKRGKQAVLLNRLRAHDDSPHPLASLGRALGAEPARVIWMVMRGVLLLLVIGVAVGVPAALAGPSFPRSSFPRKREAGNHVKPAR